MKICRRCLISGKVQGVFYRASTGEQARRLGITGYAKNLSDGRVEVLAYGEETKVKELIDWLWQGPSAAKVDGVEVMEANMAEMPTAFTTK